jgi:nucleolar protein 56
MPVMVTKWFGVFIVEHGRVQAEKRFPLQARAVADRLRGIRTGKVLDEEQELRRPGLDVLEPRLRELGKLNEKSPFFDLDVPEPDAAILHEASLLVGREESKQASGERDRAVAHSVRAMEELTVTLNTLVERIREWYALHLPEALRHLPQGQQLVDALAKDPRPEAIIAMIPKLKDHESIGAELGPDESAAIQGFAKTLSALYEERARMEKRVAAESRIIAPTLSAVVGDVIAAKLIAKAGSLEKLAHVPASTVQTLGAETALFQHLKERKKPPKHGILFQHGVVNTAPRWQRGKMARVLAGAASIAARIDFFGAAPKDRAKQVIADLESQVTRIRVQYKQPRTRVAKPLRPGRPWKQRPKGAPIQRRAP